MSRKFCFFSTPTKKKQLEKGVTQIPSLVESYMTLEPLPGPPGFPQHTGKELLKLWEILKYCWARKPVEVTVAYPTLFTRF